MGSHRRLGKKCLTCGLLLLDTNKTGFCNKHRDRTGTKNPFYGKKHSEETITAIKNKNQRISTEHWKDAQYRGAVIKGVSKPRSILGRNNISIGVLRSYVDNTQLRKLRSDKMKSYWEQGKIFFNEHNSNSVSNLQKEIFTYIKSLFQDAVLTPTFKLFNGKWVFPDIFIPSIGFVIEVYGNYWHANPKLYKESDTVNGILAKDTWKKDDLRVQNFNNIPSDRGMKSYDIMIIWEYDWKRNRSDIINSLNKLHTLYEYEGCSF